MHSRAKFVLLTTAALTTLGGCGSEISVTKQCSETWYEDRDGDGYGNRMVTLDADPAKNCAKPNGWVEDPNDCDDENPDRTPETVWYRDADGDGYGNPDEVNVTCYFDYGWVEDASDCNDEDESINPDTVWFADADGDGFGDPSAQTVACAAPAGAIRDAGDCDDGSAAIFPGALEVCDGADNDCDTLIDGDDPTLDASTSTPHYVDGDGDGYGSDNNILYTCDTAHPPGYVGQGGDCDDGQSAVSPGAQEVCFTPDDDCDGLVDDADPSVAPSTAWYPDADLDGYGDPLAPLFACVMPPGYTTDTQDCDDSSDRTFPGAAPSDHLTACMADEDLDGYGDLTPPPGVVPGTDCDDTSALTFPGAAPSDHPSACMADEDLDGYGDLTPPPGGVPGTDCDDASALTFPGAAPNDSTYLCLRDVDGDGWGSATAAAPVVAGSDCNDVNAAVSPSASERCSTVYDDDCDGQINESSAIDTVTSYFDGDGDGFGRGAPIYSCVAGPGTAPVGGDCVDTNAAINPGASESCNGIDDDCNGVTDDDYAVDALDWYDDQDDDGFGSTIAATRACTNPNPSLYAGVGTDCDDTNARVYPGAPEFCDGMQNDCDIAGWTDASEDGLVSKVSTAGVWTDVTGAYPWTNPAVPTGYTISTAGTLWFCRGDFYGRLVVGNPVNVSLKGRHGSSATTLRGSPTSGAIELLITNTVATIEGLTIADSGAPYGAAIEARASALTVRNTAFLSNHATQSGGAISADSLTSFVVEDTLFDGNSAGTEGGAIRVIDGTTAQITRSTFRDNASLGFGRTGGAVHAATLGRWNVVDSLFESNTAHHGGALAAEATAASGNTTQNCTFVNNAAVTEGGAVRAMVGYTDIGSTFEGNQAQEGGGLAMISGGLNSLAASTFTANTATRGGAIRVEGAGTGELDLDSVLLEDNTATSLGGAISLLNARATLTTVDMFRNGAPLNAGSGLHLSGSSVQAVASDLGTGVDDNDNADDVYVLEVLGSWSFSSGATFFCDATGC